MNKEMLIDAICGKAPSSTLCDRLVKAGMMRFSGNQWGEDWAWRRAALEGETEESLLHLYRYIGGAVGA